MAEDWRSRQSLDDDGRVHLAQDWRGRPGVFFAYTLGVILLLVVAAFYYARAPSPTTAYWSFSFQPIVPLWVPWAGALGGATISLVGTVVHYDHWDPKYTLWHLARPVLGAISGTVGVLIVVLVLKSVSASPTDTSATVDGVVYDDAGVAVLAVISFVIGYREATFRALVQKVVDVVLGPGDSATSTVAFVPAFVEVSAEAGGSQETRVHVFNGTPDGLGLTLRLDPADAGFTAVADPPDQEIPPSQSRAVRVTWAPTATSAVPASATLTAVLGGQSATLQLRGLTT